MNQRMRGVLEEDGYDVQTTRIATNPFGEWLSGAFLRVRVRAHAHARVRVCAHARLRERLMLHRDTEQCGSVGLESMMRKRQTLFFVFPCARVCVRACAYVLVYVRVRVRTCMYVLARVLVIRSLYRNEPDDEGQLMSAHEPENVSS